jgi:hypothetical protein
MPTTVRVVANENRSTEARQWVLNLNRDKRIQALFWTEKQFVDNELKSGRNDRFIFLGPTGPGDQYAGAMDSQFQQCGVEAKVGGTRAVISVDPTCDWRLDVQRQELREVMTAHKALLSSESWCRKPTVVIDDDEFNAPRNYEIEGKPSKTPIGHFFSILSKEIGSAVDPGNRRHWTFENEIIRERYAYGISRFIDECLDDFLGLS